MAVSPRFAYRRNSAFGDCPAKIINDGAVNIKK
jgi:hypothetical protein